MAEDGSGHGHLIRAFGVVWARLRGGALTVRDVTAIVAFGLTEGSVIDPYAVGRLNRALARTRLIDRALRRLSRGLLRTKVALRRLAQGVDRAHRTLCRARQRARSARARARSYGTLALGALLLLFLCVRGLHYFIV